MYDLPRGGGGGPLFQRGLDRDPRAYGIPDRATPGMGGIFGSHDFTIDREPERGRGRGRGRGDEYERESQIGHRNYSSSVAGEDRGYSSSRQSPGLSWRSPVDDPFRLAYGGMDDFIVLDDDREFSRPHSHASSPSIGSPYVHPEDRFSRSHSRGGRSPITIYVDSDTEVPEGHRPRSRDPKRSRDPSPDRPSKSSRSDLHTTPYQGSRRF
eukprot:TRINITY_DN4025_c0_g1_i4.p1 TRINITY_DN4025_c0_g1~~TRINITY_DN4025_c0_g1_i4.p1  ORF type:complete len:211 (-),score=31.13 TRINITY_DN4025_c0_g1_i4:263-895(-)